MAELEEAYPEALAAWNAAFPSVSMEQFTAGLAAFCESARAYLSGSLAQSEAGR